MDIKSVSILYNKTTRSYFVRIEFDNPLKIQLIDKVGLNEDEQTRLLDFYKDLPDPEHKYLLADLKLKRKSDDEYGWSELNDFIRKYNDSLEPFVDWRKYASLEDKTLSRIS